MRNLSLKIKINLEEKSDKMNSKDMNENKDSDQK